MNKANPTNDPSTAAMIVLVSVPLCLEPVTAPVSAERKKGNRNYRHCKF